MVAGGIVQWPTEVTTAVHYYNTTSPTWGTRGQLCQARYGLSIITLGPYVIISGGLSRSEKSVIVDIYKIVNNTWTISHLETARGAPSAVVTADERWFGPTYGKRNNWSVQSRSLFMAHNRREYFGKVGSNTICHSDIWRDIVETVINGQN